jgi:cell division protease FtsH
MGGRVAEKLVLNHYTTGAGNDIERATELARKMITEWGMSDKLGPLAYGKKDEEIFLGREIATHRDYSEKTAQEIDQEIKRVVSAAEEKTFKLLSENIAKLHALAGALLEREILDGHEIDMVLAGEQLPDKIASRRYATFKSRTAGNGKGADGAAEKPKKATKSPRPVKTTTPVKKKGSKDDSDKESKDEK